jgi:phage terminase large subunit-like protein
MGVGGKELNQKIIRWWIGTAMQAIDITRYKVTVIGTPMLQDDLINSLTASDKYHSVKFPVAEEFPVPLATMRSAWPDRFTPLRIKEKFDEAKDLGSENEFFREMMLEVVNDDTRVFKPDWIKWFEWKDIRHRKREMNYFTTMDLAVSKKQHSDFSVVMTIGVDSEGIWYIVAMDRGKFTPSEVIDKIFNHVRTWNPLEVRAEKAALQQVLDHFIEQKMLKEKTHFYYQPLENNSVQKKEYRILGLQPLFKHRKIYLRKDAYIDEMEALHREILGFTREGSTTRNDDAIDTMANFLDPNFVFTPSDYKKEENVEYGSGTIPHDSTVF